MDRSTNQNKPFIPSKEECLSLLKKYDTPKSVIEHCLVVSQVALEIFENNENYNEDEKELLIAGAILHDIGRAVTHCLLHGIEGVKILQKENIDPRIVQIVKTHIGTGLTVDEAKKFGLPLDDYFPKTIIEIIVSHADKLVNGAEIVSFNEACEKLVRKFGEDTLIVKNFHKQKQLIENTKRKKL